MLQHLIARYRAWQVQLDTARLLEPVDDRLLADMGIERGAIKTIARNNARAAVAQHHNGRSASATHCAQPDHGLLA